MLKRALGLSALLHLMVVMLPVAGELGAISVAAGFGAKRSVTARLVEHPPLAQLATPAPSTEISQVPQRGTINQGYRKRDRAGISVGPTASVPVNTAVGSSAETGSDATSLLSYRLALAAALARNGLPELTSGLDGPQVIEIELRHQAEQPGRLALRWNSGGLSAEMRDTISAVVHNSAVELPWPPGVTRIPLVFRIGEPQVASGSG